MRFWTFADVFETIGILYNYPLALMIWRRQDVVFVMGRLSGVTGSEILPQSLTTFLGGSALLYARYLLSGRTISGPDKAEAKYVAFTLTAEANSFCERLRYRSQPTLTVN